MVLVLVCIYLILEVVVGIRFLRWEFGIGFDLDRFEDNGDFVMSGKWDITNLGYVVERVT